MDPLSRTLNELQKQLAVLASAAEDFENASVAVREKNQDQVKEILHRGAQKLHQASAASSGLVQQLAEAQSGGGYGSPPRFAQTWPRGPLVFGDPATPPTPERGGGRRARMSAQEAAGFELNPLDSPPTGPDGEEVGDPLSPAVFEPIPVPAEEPSDPREREALEDRVRSQFGLLYWPYRQLMEDGVEMDQVQELVRSCRDALYGGALRDAAVSLNAAAELMRSLLAPEEPPAPAQ
jgi:hypothetical protein